MKIVEAISISPQEARVVVAQYEEHARKAKPFATDKTVNKLVTEKIIARYSKLAAGAGAATSLTGVIPGVGTVFAAVGGGLADLSVCMKLQIDMTMCLAVAINKRLSNEDAKHMSAIIALSGVLEKFAANGVTEFGSRAGVKLVKQHLTGAALKIIKDLFRRVGIAFTQKAALKVIPFGVGVAIGASANYKLTQYVGKIARDMFLLDVADQREASNHAMS